MCNGAGASESRKVTADAASAWFRVGRRVPVVLWFAHVRQFLHPRWTAWYLLHDPARTGSFRCPRIDVRCRNTTAGENNCQRYRREDARMLTFLVAWRYSRRVAIFRLFRGDIYARGRWIYISRRHGRPAGETMGIVQSRAGEGDGGVREVFIGGIKGGTPLQSCQPSLGMGSLGGPHARSGSVRGAPRQPMPDAVELERRFTKVLVSRKLHIYLTRVRAFLSCFP